MTDYTTRMEALHSTFPPDAIGLRAGAGRRRGARLCMASLALLLCGPLGCDAAGAPNTTSSDDGGAHFLDASLDAHVGDKRDSGKPDAAAPDAGSDEDAGGPCTTNADCNDDLVCNGEERCDHGHCAAGAAPVCTREHPCSEAQRGCDCSNPNMDGDGFIAEICGGDDCDDGNAAINKMAHEVCDLHGVDEDCDPTTYYREGYDGDADGDHGIDIGCYNIDEKGKKHGGGDCNDKSPVIYKGNSEVCDYNDNDCDGFVDETLDKHGHGNHDNGGMQEDFYPDLDGDGCGDMHADPQRACGYEPLAGYIRGTDPCDCDDNPETGKATNLHAPEICDGKDNDCDQLTDAQDPDLKHEYDFTNTEVECVAADWTITHCPDDAVFCPGDQVQYGCARDATQLDTCRACHTDCTFACGNDGCDEITKLGAGLDVSCAITREGRVACWGRGAEGRLGNDGTSSQLVPSLVTGIRDAKDIAVGADSSCAVVGDARELYCWGSNAHGQLANDPKDSFSAVPIRAVGIDDESVLSGIASIAVAQQHACAVLANGTLVCWGSDANGRLANGNAGDGTTELPAPAQRTGYSYIDNARAVALGERHGCVITNENLVECWGDNTYGQLGDPTFEAAQSDVARAVPNLGPVTMVTAGQYHTCVLRSGEVLCWGFNSRLELGRESGDDEGVPKPVAGLSDVVSIAAGSEFTCALDATGSVFCWGSNEAGERGDMEASNSAIPNRVSLDDVVSLTAGAIHACALTELGQANCWGYNFLGQLGVGETFTAAQPIPLPIKPLNRALK